VLTVPTAAAGQAKVEAGAAAYVGVTPGAFAAEATNCCVPPPYSVAVVGVIEMLLAGRTVIAGEVTVGSPARLVIPTATVTGVEVLTDAGAV
jgi:hypothetical protein